jgi:hypothetical protein
MKKHNECLKQLYLNNQGNINENKLEKKLNNLILKKNDSK